MAIRTLQQVLETHNQIVQRFQKHKKTLSKARPAGSDLVVKQKRRLLANLDERLDDAKRARAESIKRHDAEIARIELNRKKLAEEIAADEKNLGGAPVKRVKGIGREYGSRLERNSIRSAGDLAAANPAQVAEVLSISESKAKELVSAARKVK